VGYCINTIACVALGRKQQKLNSLLFSYENI